MLSILIQLAALSLPFLEGAAAWDTSIKTVVTAFNNAQIPQDIHIKFNPIELFDVSFPQASGPPIKLSAGETVLRNETVIPVTFAVNANFIVDPLDSFVIAMVDPDVPTPTNNTFGQFRHFLGGNFHASLPDFNGISTLWNSTPAITEYFQPTPPAGSPPHRYIFLLFQQPVGFNEQNFVNSTTTQFFFNISQFAEETHLGNPLAGSFALIGPDANSQPFNP